MDDILTSVFPSVDVLILCHNRQEEVQKAIKSCQREGIGSVFVLDNGSDEVVIVPHGVQIYRSEENLGPCAGRNLLASQSKADFLLFLDDDAVINDETDVGALVTQFLIDDRLAIIAGLVRRSNGHIAKHEFPSRKVLRVNERRVVGYFVEGACMIKRSSFLEAGGYDSSFFYGHEATDLALRLAQLGQRIVYDPALSFTHRPSSSGRSKTANTYVRQFRNRKILARRNLPFPFSLIHVTVWFAYYLLQTCRVRISDAPKLLVAAIRRVEKRKTSFPATRLSLRAAQNLHKLGYRIYW